MSTERVSTEALARKKRFNEIKSARTEVEDRKWRIFFNEETGIITATTQDKTFNGHDDWMTYPFTQDELTALELDSTKSKHKMFRVEASKDQIGVYKIVPANISGNIVSADRSFLHEIESVTDAEFKESAIKCQVKRLKSGRVLEINASKQTRIDIKQQVGENSPTQARIFVTARHNPHLLYTVLTVKLADLSKKKVKLKIPEQVPTEFSLYTMKKFSSYGRKD